MVETKRTYTTGEVATLCNVTKRTVIKWIDSDKLRGYLVPGSTHRPVTRQGLADFMHRHGMPDPSGALPLPRLFIVDDDRDFTDLLKEALRDQFDIEIAGSALEAASRIPLFRPNLILLDIRLPDLSGLDVCRHFRDYKRERKVPILCMSAYGHEIDVAEVRKCGADDFLPKPIKLNDLRKQLRAMVG